MRTGAAGKKSVVWLIEDHADSRRVLARVLNRADHAVPLRLCPCEDALAA